MFCLGEDSCLCDVCRQAVKRALSGHVQQSKKKEWLPCFLSIYRKCNEMSFVDSTAVEWNDFVSKN